MSASTFSRADTADHPCSIFDGLLRVEGSLFAGESLANDFGVFRESQVLSRGFIASETNAEFTQLKSVWKWSERAQHERMCEKCLKINQTREKNPARLLVGCVWRSLAGERSIISHDAL